VTAASSTISIANAGNMLFARSGHVLVPMPDSRVISYGGAVGASEVYNPTTNLFTSLSGATSSGAATGTALATGGAVLISGTSATFVSLSGSTLSAIGTQTLPASPAFVTPLGDGSALVVGGTSTAVVTMSGVTSGPAVLTRGAGAHGELMADGSVLVAGGGTATVERWTADAVTAIDAYL